MAQQVITLKTQAGSGSYTITLYAEYGTPNTANRTISVSTYATINSTTSACGAGGPSLVFNLNGNSLGTVNSIQNFGSQGSYNWGEYKSPTFSKTLFYDSEGMKEVKVAENKEVKVVAIGVGTRSFPVKIIVEDKDGNQFFQNVAMSKTNSGMRDDEFIMTKAKNTFYGSFELADAKIQATESYAKYIGKHVYTKYATKMENMMGENVNIPRLSQFTIKKIEAIDNTNYVKMSLQSSKDGYQYVKHVTFKNESVIGDIDGNKEDYYKYLFAEGTVGKGVSAKNMELIRKGRLAKGFTKNEVKLALGEPQRRATVGGNTVWYYNNGNVVIKDTTINEQKNFLVDKFSSLPIDKMEEVVSEMLDNLNGDQVAKVIEDAFDNLHEQGLEQVINYVNE